MTTSVRFSSYNPRLIVYNFNKQVLDVLYITYAKCGEIPESTMGTMQLAIQCERKGLELHSVLDLINKYKKGCHDEHTGDD